MGIINRLLLFLFTLSFMQVSYAYDFPITDRFAATIVGTPPDLRAEIPKEIPVKTYQLESIHDIPALFWYQRGLKFSAALQTKPAPLIFNIAGTGAAYHSPKLVNVQKALYQAGFHVINISSPTHMNFQVNGSSSILPGYLPDDAKDLYRVMQQAYQMVAGEITVTDTHITGYSLGAIHAAFVAKLDSEQKHLGLKRVFMINPPVNVYNSVSILDDMLEQNIEGGARGSGAFLDFAIDRLAAAYHPKAGMRLDGDFLYRAYESFPPEQRGRGPDGRDGGAALIAFSFRLTSGAMVFVGDLMTDAGYVIPKGKTFSRREPVDYYAAASHQVRFSEYVDDLLIPYLEKKYPGKNRQQFIQDSSLHAIKDFVRTNPNIYAVSNRNEIILAPGELKYMEHLFGNRIRVFPEGGHCGNMDHRDNVAHMISVLKGQGASS